MPLPLLNHVQQLSLSSNPESINFVHLYVSSFHILSLLFLCTSLSFFAKRSTTNSILSSPYALIGIGFSSTFALVVSFICVSFLGLGHFNGGVINVWQVSEVQP